MRQIAAFSYVTTGFCHQLLQQTNDIGTRAFQFETNSSQLHKRKEEARGSTTGEPLQCCAPRGCSTIAAPLHLTQLPMIVIIIRFSQYVPFCKCTSVVVVGQGSPVLLSCCVFTPVLFDTLILSQLDQKIKIEIKLKF